MKKIIIASHGDLSKGLKNSLQMILGSMADPIVTYSLYPGQSAMDFAEQIFKEVQNNLQDEYVIFTDVYGASVCNSMYPLTVNPNVILFAGMNLNLIIEYMVSYPNPLRQEDIDQLLLLSREGLRQVTFDAAESQDDDF